MPRSSVITAITGGVFDNAPDGTRSRVPITVSASQVGSTLTSFPTYVRMSDLPAHFWANVQSDGGDIRVTESDGTTRCPVDLVSIDTGTTTGELHFGASSLSAVSDTTFYLYYNATATLSQPAVGDTYGRNAVWTDYAGVWHLQETPSGTDSLIDSTGLGNHGTPNGSVSADTGILGQGVRITTSGTTGHDEYVTMGTAVADVTNDLTFTLSAWLKPATNPENTYGVVAGKGIVGGGIHEYVLAQNGSDGTWRGIVRDPDATAVVGSNALGNGSWSHLAMTGDGTTVYGFVDGAPDGTDGTTGLTPDTSSRAFAVGGSPDATTRSINGTVDEVRVSGTQRSAAWLASEYTNQATPTTFYTIGGEESA